MRVSDLKYLRKRLIFTSDEKTEENIITDLGQVGWACQRELTGPELCPLASDVTG